MTLPGLLGLVALALVDSTSIGTLIIPLWLLLRPGWRVRLIVVYLATITGFYLLVGLLLMAGALTVLPAVGAVLGPRRSAWIRARASVSALVALSFWIDPKAVRKRAAKAGREMQTAPRWQQRIDRAAATPTGMITLALGAGLAEVATMLPYLAAIAIISSFGLSALASGLTLAGYTLVMMLPALGLVDCSPRRRPSGQRGPGSVGRLAGPAHGKQRLVDRRDHRCPAGVGRRGASERFRRPTLVSMTLEFLPYELGRGHVDYLDGWDLQRRVHAEVVAEQRPDTVILLEHASVYTAGKRTEAAERPTDGTPVVDVDRGGKITWHGPGQLVGYPIVRLPESVYVVDYVRRLEEAIIALFATFGLTTGRVPGRSGVLASRRPFGVRTSRSGRSPPSASGSPRVSRCTASPSTSIPT